MSDDSPYRPIDCSLHDRIEDLATRRRAVAIRYEDESATVEITDTIADWFVRDGVELMRLGSGATILLDRILEIDGVVYAANDGDGSET